jgi:pterin-4a-carbinolamine dehydratase
MYTEAQNLLATVEPEWKLWKHETEEDDEHDKAAELDNNIIPFAIVRDFWHKDYMQGAQFVTHVSAVAQMNDHYPHQVILDRYLSRREKAWKVRTRIICRTVVLQGLSHHDFFLATLLDVETKRPEVAGLLAGTQKERKL